MQYTWPCPDLVGQKRSPYVYPSKIQIAGLSKGSHQTATELGKYNPGMMGYYVTA